jgi:hypothetical protein
VAAPLGSVRARLRGDELACLLMYFLAHLKHIWIWMTKTFFAAKLIPSRQIPTRVYPVQRKPP